MLYHGNYLDDFLMPLTTTFGAIAVWCVSLPCNTNACPGPTLRRQRWPHYLVTCNMLAALACRCRCWPCVVQARQRVLCARVCAHVCAHVCVVCGMAGMAWAATKRGTQDRHTLPRRWPVCNTAPRNLRKPSCTHARTHTHTRTRTRTGGRALRYFTRCLGIMDIVSSTAQYV